MKKQKSDLEKVLNPLLGFYRSRRYMEQDDFTVKIIKGLKGGLNCDVLVCKKFSDDAIKILKLIKPPIKDYYVVTVPSHDPDKTSPGLVYIAKQIINALQMHDGISFLKRSKFVEKSSITNKRDVQTHIDSLEVGAGVSLMNKNILLFDDVKTSGATLEACKLVLIKNSAKSVLTMCLAESVLKLDNRTKTIQNDFLKNKIKILENITLS